MTIRNLDVDTPYGESVQATVCEITGMNLRFEPVTKEVFLELHWNVYSTLADAAGGAAALVVDTKQYTGTLGDPGFPMSEVEFNKLRSWMYDQIQAEPGYEGGTEHLD
jgi:hypothetical protein